jgi:uncharacterized membrane protein/DNA-binding CsgD family transcriptional regulator
LGTADSAAPFRSYRAGDDRTVGRAAVVLGIGLGGFVDGILLHQLLQWHHMVSSRVSMHTLHGLETNTLADGVFQALAWFITAIGVALFWRASRRGETAPGPRAFAGLLLLGWGVFNAVDEVGSHLLLGLHHIREDASHFGYDAPFGVLALLQIAAGAALARPSAPAFASRRERVHVEGRPARRDCCCGAHRRQWRRAPRPESNAGVVEEFARRPMRAQGPPHAVEELTPREREVLNLLVRGLSSPEICERLVISEAIAKTHVARILQKLGVRDRVQVVIYARIGHVRILRRK